jgi:hypothetical protein
MTNPTMTSQWDPGSYRPLDMSEIPGYPREMPPRYEHFLPRFAGIDDECPKSHMRRFWKFFQHFPVDDEVEDLVMKLFSASLHGEARRWYDNLPAASINSMERFEELFIAKWTMEMEVVYSLLKDLEGIRQAESEVVRAFGVRFQRLLYQIPQSHRPKGNYLVYLYINGLQACYPRYLWITRRSCIEAHMVLDMEYREQKLLEHGPGGPIFFFSASFVLSAVPASITIGLGLHQKRLLLHEVIGPRYHGMCHI